MADNRDHKARETSRSEGAFTAGDASAGEAPDERGETYDLSALQADDALLDAIGSGDSDVETAGPLSTNQAEALLVSWRRQTDGEPIGELVDTDTAVRVVTDASAQQRRRRRHRFLVPLTTAAAVVLIGFTVVGFAARSAEPGDTLWAVTQVLYSDHAESVQTAADARKDLGHARQLLHNGKSDRSRVLVDRVSGSLHSVHDEDGRAKLQRNTNALLEKLPEGTPRPGSSSTSSSSTAPPGSGASDSSGHSRLNPASDSSDSSESSSETSGSPTTSPTTTTEESSGEGTHESGDHSSHTSKSGRHAHDSSSHSSKSTPET